MALRNIGAITFAPAQFHLARYNREVAAEQVLADYPKAQAIMAGPMFGRTGSRSCGGGVTPCTRLFEPARNVDYPSKFPASGMTLSVVRGAAVMAPGDTVSSGATVAVQLYPSLVHNGANVGSRTAESSVAGLGVLNNGKLLYLVGSGGTLADLGEEFVRRGAVAAGYADAGSSAALYVRGEGWRGAHAGPPTLPTWLTVEEGGALGSGVGTLVGLALTMVVAGMFWWTVKR